MSVGSPSIHVDDIGHRLKGIKGNPDWQNHCKVRQERSSSDPIHRVGKESVVFKEAQDRQIGSDRYKKEESFPLVVFCFGYQTGQIEIETDGEQH